MWEHDSSISPNVHNKISLYCMLKCAFDNILHRRTLYAGRTHVHDNKKGNKKGNSQTMSIKFNNQFSPKLFLSSKGVFSGNYV